LPFHDKLTGLGIAICSNRSWSGAMAEGAAPLDGVGVIYIDLDDFKRVNDSLGHSAGTELLCRIAERLLTVAGDRPGYPPGGDEFLLLVPT